MKIIHLAAGTGNFYCGNCVRDNAMVHSMLRQGHEILMVPLYLPLYPDENSAAADIDIFFGGVNVYLQQKFSLFQYTPRWFDRVFDSSPVLTLAGKMMGMTRAKDLGELTLSMLKGEEGGQKKELHRLIAWLKSRPKPDVISLSNGLFCGFAKTLKEELNTKVVCHLQGEDGFLDSLPSPYSQQAWEELKRQSQYADAFIAVSRYYAERIQQRIQTDGKMHVVLNGISLNGYAPERTEPAERTIGYLARMCFDKGIHTLTDMFIELKRDEAFSDVQLKVAGVVLPQDQSFLQAQKKKLRQAGIEQDVLFYPNVTRDEKLRFLESLTAFSVPALYGEAFGLYVLEALAAGVPVVQPRHGGFTEILQETRGGLLFDPEQPDAYLEAIKEMLISVDSRLLFSRQGKEAVHSRFSIDHMTRNLCAVYEGLLTV